MTEATNRGDLIVIQAAKVVIDGRELHDVERMAIPLGELLGPDDSPKRKTESSHATTAS